MRRVLIAILAAALAAAMLVGPVAAGNSWSRSMPSTNGNSWSR